MSLKATREGERCSGWLKDGVFVSFHDWEGLQFENSGMETKRGLKKNAELRGIL